eukprot:1136122-Pelagomonas_calceolata.AAC.2
MPHLDACLTQHLCWLRVQAARQQPHDVVHLKQLLLLLLLFTITVPSLLAHPPCWAPSLHARLQRLAHRRSLCVSCSGLLTIAAARKPLNPPDATVSTAVSCSSGILGPDRDTGTGVAPVQCGLTPHATTAALAATAAAAAAVAAAASSAFCHSTPNAPHAAPIISAAAAAAAAACPMRASLPQVYPSTHIAHGGLGCVCCVCTWLPRVCRLQGQQSQERFVVQGRCVLHCVAQHLPPHWHAHLAAEGLHARATGKVFANCKHSYSELFSQTSELWTARRSTCRCTGMRILQPRASMHAQLVER